MTDTPKPCPFCAVEPQRDDRYCRCTHDDCAGFLLDWCEIGAWNRRPGEDAARAEAICQCLAIVRMSPHQGDALCALEALLPDGYEGYAEDRGWARATGTPEGGEL